MDYKITNWNGKFGSECCLDMEIIMIAIEKIIYGQMYYGEWKLNVINQLGVK